MSKNLLILCCHFFFAANASCQTTALDSAFGTNGRLTTQGLPGIDPDFPVFCTQQADGKLLTASSFTYVGSGPTQPVFDAVRIQRWLPTGRPDSTFNGTAMSEYTNHGRALDIRTMANGKTLAVARTSTAVLALRMRPDGTRDSSYHGAGIAINASPQMWDAAILNDGGIVFVGSSYSSSGGYDLAVLKLDSSGNPDVGFGNAGLRLYSFGPGTTTFGVRIAAASNGKFLVSAIKDLAGTGTDSVGVMRILADGSPDLSFGNNGAVFRHISHTWIRAEDVIEGPGGAVTFAAYYQPQTDTLYHRTLFRTTSSGTMDATFGVDGVRRLTSIPLQNTYANVGFYDRGGRTTLTHQADGKLLVGYTSSISTGLFSEPSLVRLLPDGAYDASFGVNGWMSSYMQPFTMNSDVLIQQDGKIIQAGNGFDRVDMVRYKPISLVSVESVSLAAWSTRIYPNPTTGGKVYIEGIPTTGTISILDALGRTFSAPFNNGVLDVNHLTLGLYFLQVRSLEGSATFRLIKSGGL